MWLRSKVKVRRASFRLAILLLWAAATGLASAHAAVLSLAGGYNGTGRATGMAMILEQDEERIYGRIVDGLSNIYQISGRVNGNTVQGTVYNQASAANFQLELGPSGLKLVLVPLVDGRPDLAAMKQVSFERGRITHPALADYRVPPPRPGDVLDVLAFLESYRSWTKEEVAIGFAGLADKDRAAIRKFDHLQADIMNRLCRTKTAPGDLAAISIGQALDCAELTAVFDGAEQAGVLRRFTDMAEFQRGALYAKIACDRNLTAASRCTGNAPAGQDARDWRDAGRIIADLSTARGQPGPVGAAPSFAPPRLAAPALPQPPGSGASVRALPRPKAPPSKAAEPVKTAGAEQPADKSGFVAFFQSKTPTVTEPEPAPVAQTRPESLFADLDMSLRPSTALAAAKSVQPPDAEADFMTRVERKMRERPVPSKVSIAPPAGSDAKLNHDGASGTVVKVPNPRPRPRRGG
jgi:hypothetical protein